MKFRGVKRRFFTEKFSPRKLLISPFWLRRCKILRCFLLRLLWNSFAHHFKREGSELPPSLLSLATPLESSFLIGRDVTLSFVPIGPKNDVHQKSKAKSPSITGSSETPMKKSGVALEFWCTSFFGPIGRRRLWNTVLWLVPPLPTPLLKWCAKEFQSKRGAVKKWCAKYSKAKIAGTPETI